MGIAPSSTSTPTPTPHPAQLKIGDGLYGVVYANSDNTVTKKQKLKTDTLKPGTEAWRESRAFDWIDTIIDPRMQRFFAQRIKQITTHDPAWTHLPKFYIDRVAVLKVSPERVSAEDTAWLTEATVLLEERNAYPYVHELTMERKGRPIDKQLITPAKINRAIVELLTVIHFMQQAGVMHTDIHAGNIVMQADGAIALIDYGEFYFKGDPTYEKHAREHVMVSQFVGMCIDIINNFEIEEALDDASSVNPIERRVDTALETGDMADFLTRVCTTLSYTYPIDKARNAPRMHNLVVCVLFDRMKLKYPDDFKRMMGWPATSVLHSWITLEDLEFVLMHMGDLPAVIAYFEIKQRF